MSPRVVGHGGTWVERTRLQKGREKERQGGRARGRCCGNGLGTRERRKDYEARHLAPRSHAHKPTHAHVSTCRVVYARGSRRSRPELSPTFALSSVADRRGEATNNPSERVTNWPASRIRASLLRTVLLLLELALVRV